MHPHETTLHTFYRAFAALDPDTMARCYAPGVHFRDPVFDLNGREEVMGMWRMLCEAVQARGRQDWTLEFSGVSADTATGRAHWQATYRFGPSGRLVQNQIDAQVQFDASGCIVQHTDRFDFWRWSRQALGATGLLLGWSPLLHSQVKTKANASLRKYLASRR